MRCNEANLRPSMGSLGDAYDNAICESFFATLEHELLERERCRKRGTVHVSGAALLTIRGHRSSVRSNG